MENLYKNKGSVVIWVLKNNLHEAFVVWMLAQAYDRRQHDGKSTGLVSSPFFTDILTTQMHTNKKTAKKRLEKAVDNRFLCPLDNGKYVITSHRAMVGVAMDDQQRRHEDKQTGNPTNYLEADREYTMSLGNWIDPEDMYNTVSKLSAVEEIQAGVIGRGRETQGELVGRARRTMIRRTHDTGNTIIKQYILLDAQKLLIDADCSQMDAINAFIRAEELARKVSPSFPGRTIFHKKHIFNYARPLLAIQLPNAYTNHVIIKEVPANRERCQWLRKAGLTDVRSIASGGHEQHQYTTWQNSQFLNSQSMGLTNQSPGNAVARAIEYLDMVLEIGECFDQILSDTGASGIRNSNAGNPRVWKEKVKSSDVTPLSAPVSTSRNHTIFSC